MDYSRAVHMGLGREGGLCCSNVHDGQASFHFGQIEQEREDQTSKNRNPCPSPAHFQGNSGLGGELAAFHPFLLSPPPEKRQTLS